MVDETELSPLTVQAAQQMEAVIPHVGPDQQVDHLQLAVLYLTGTGIDTLMTFVSSLCVCLTHN